MGEREVVKREGGRMGDHVVVGSGMVGVREVMYMRRCEGVQICCVWEWWE